MSTNKNHIFTLAAGEVVNKYYFWRRLGRGVADTGTFIAVAGASLYWPSDFANLVAMCMGGGAFVNIFADNSSSFHTEDFRKVAAKTLGYDARGDVRIRDQLIFQRQGRTHTEVSVTREELRAFRRNALFLGADKSVPARAKRGLAYCIGHIANRFQ